MSRVILPLGDMPPAITDSARAVFKAHGYSIVGSAGPLDEHQLDALLRELGKNAAQALYAIGTDPEDLP